MTTVKIEMRYAFSNLFIICFTKHVFYILKFSVLVCNHSLAETNFVTLKKVDLRVQQLAIFVININWLLKRIFCECSFSL